MYLHETILTSNCDRPCQRWTRYSRLRRLRTSLRPGEWRIRLGRQELSRRFLGRQPHSIILVAQARPTSHHHRVHPPPSPTHFSPPPVHLSSPSPRSGQRITHTQLATCLPNRSSSSSGATSTRWRAESMSSRASTASLTLAPSLPSMACA